MASSQPAVPRAVSPFPLRPALLLLGRRHQAFPPPAGHPVSIPAQSNRVCTGQCAAWSGSRPVVEQHAAFKDVRIPAAVLDRRLRLRNLQHVAQLVPEQLVISPLRPSPFAPPRDECANRLLVHARRRDFKETGCKKRDGRVV